MGFLRGRWGRYQRTALTIALSSAAIAAPLQVVIGDWAAREVASAQPTKLAALEGLSSILTPFALGTVVGGIASGRVPVGNAAGDPITSWLNPAQA
jgi:cytochrome bd ubiquinol oxidase subunit I